MQRTEDVVSVVIPVYNAGATLRACMDSVLGQSHAALEVLAVDDGSRDDSLEILRGYQRRDGRVRVFSVPNGGAASARNYGVERAAGRYLQFVDSDDALPPDATLSLVEAMRAADADLAIAPFTEVIGRARHTRGFLREGGVYDQPAFLGRLVKRPNSFYFAVLWNKLYRRDIVMREGVRCDAGVPWGEDFLFNMAYYRHIRRAVALSAPVYEYRRSLDGLASSFVKLCFRHPFYSMGVKLRLWRGYKALYRAAGLYDRYRLALPAYLFTVTLNN